MKTELLESAFARYTGIGRTQLRLWRKTGERVPGVRWTRSRRATGETLIRYDARVWNAYVAAESARQGKEVDQSELVRALYARQAGAAPHAA